MVLLFLFFYCFLPGVSIIGLRKHDYSSQLRKDTTTELRGLGMLLIILAHAVGTYINNITFFFYVSAVLGVGSCFFLSGYGLYKSFLTKERYLDRFLVFKFARILIPFTVLFILTVTYSLLTGKFNLSQKIIELFTLRIDELLLWYLKIQLLLYLFFYLSFRFLSKRAIIGVFVLTIVYILVAWTAGLVSYWYNSCIFFPFGILIAKYDQKIIPLLYNKLCVLISFFVFILIFLLIFFFGRMGIEYIINTVYIISFIALMLFFFNRWTGSIVLSFFGKCSMEVYLIHLLLLKYNLFGLFSPDKVISYILLLGITAITSWMLFVADNRIAKLLIR